MVETQPLQTTELFTVARASGAAVIALRHHDAVPGVARRDRRIDSEYTPVGRPELLCGACEESWICAKDGCDERTAATPHQRNRLIHAVKRYQGRDRAEHLDLVDGLCVIRGAQE